MLFTTLVKYASVGALLLKNLIFRNQNHSNQQKFMDQMPPFNNLSLYLHMRWEAKKKGSQESGLNYTTDKQYSNECNGFLPPLLFLSISEWKQHFLE